MSKSNRNQSWDLLVAELIRQGVVIDEAEAIRRLANGEKLQVQLRAKNGQWRGIYGTTE